MKYPLSTITLKTLTKIEKIKLDRNEHNLLSNNKKYKLLQNFFESNKKIYNTYPTINLTVTDFIPTKTDIAEIKTYSVGPFVHPELRSKISDNQWTRITCKQGKIILITKNNKYRDSVINQLPNLINIVRLIKPEKTFNVILFLTDYKKKWPKDKIIKAENANSGFTFIRGKKIFIWRFEEWSKVFIHEIVHAYNCDSGHIKNGKLNIFEGITDFWAILYHCLFISIYFNKSWQKILWNEYLFIYIQYSFLVKLWKIKKFNLTNDIQKIKQRTNGFSYYIVKFLLFYYLDDWFPKKINKRVNPKQILLIINKNFPLILKDFKFFSYSRMSLYQISRIKNI